MLEQRAVVSYCTHPDTCIFKSHEEAAAAETAFFVVVVLGLFHVFQKLVLFSVFTPPKIDYALGNVAFCISGDWLL